ncbi:uncharacterized protein CTHT_0021350 [Thermochaetoides thermophila DSM 1495]|uniref:Uncharacterized protein n=1 Tax=Chaetomium thermophilum (strain DSM 1495 / CBS 144.50 / IMI 039719) TaxID=759272 RepID=G0S8D4_CHATD|nr:hypothetical protein CTHT_0021350 [Thermochaetoides thermophila DSM 1495]EGS20309.1 hypothetical protein CTHT_0021350 [Thermochaetoides thermophila DSM 1495]
MPWSDIDLYSSDYSSGLTDEYKSHKTCQVDGCNRNRAYTKDPDTEERLYSKFCKKHTCRKLLSMKLGFHCPNSKKKDHNFCDQHRKCGIKDCPERGEWFTKKDPEWKQWYCHNHACKVPGCQSQATPSRQYCASHKNHPTCTEPGCTRPCATNPDGKPFLYCNVHYSVFLAPELAGYDRRMCAEHAKNAFEIRNEGRGHCRSASDSLLNPPDIVIDLDGLRARFDRQKDTLNDAVSGTSASSAEPASSYKTAHRTKRYSDNYEERLRMERERLKREEEEERRRETIQRLEEKVARKQEEMERLEKEERERRARRRGTLGIGIEDLLEELDLDRPYGRY